MKTWALLLVVLVSVVAKPQVDNTYLPPGQTLRSSEPSKVETFNGEESLSQDNSPPVGGARRFDGPSEKYTAFISEVDNSFNSEGEIRSLTDDVEDLNAQDRREGESVRFRDPSRESEFEEEVPSPISNSEILPSDQYGVPSAPLNGGEVSSGYSYDGYNQEFSDPAENRESNGQYSQNGYTSQRFIDAANSPYSINGNNRQYFVQDYSSRSGQNRQDDRPVPIYGAPAGRSEVDDLSEGITERTRGPEKHLQNGSPSQQYGTPTDGGASEVEELNGSLTQAQLREGAIISSSSYSPVVKNDRSEVEELSGKFNEGASRSEQLRGNGPSQVYGASISDRPSEAEELSVIHFEDNSRPSKLLDIIEKSSNYRPSTGTQSGINSGSLTNENSYSPAERSGNNGPVPIYGPPGRTSVHTASQFGVSSIQLPLVKSKSPNGDTPSRNGVNISTEYSLPSDNSLSGLVEGNKGSNIQNQYNTNGHNSRLPGAVYGAPSTRISLDSTGYDRPTDISSGEYRDENSPSYRYGSPEDLAVQSNGPPPREFVSGGYPSGQYRAPGADNSRSEDNINNPSKGFNPLSSPRSTEFTSPVEQISSSSGRLKNENPQTYQYNRPKSNALTENESLVGVQIDAASIGFTEESSRRNGNDRYNSTSADSSDGSYLSNDESSSYRNRAPVLGALVDGPSSLLRETSSDMQRGSLTDDSRVPTGVQIDDPTVQQGYPSALGGESGTDSEEFNSPDSSSGVDNTEGNTSEDVRLTTAYKAGSDQPQDPLYKPADYEFSYRVLFPPTATDFGHHERRVDQQAQGEYFVLLPDGRTQVVEYEANEDGYKPSIRYEGTLPSYLRRLRPY